MSESNHPDIKKIGNLAGLESFDPKAFEADEEVPQDVCNFVLSLAVIFNDLKDLLHADELLDTQRPEGNFRVTRHWGDYSGIYGHIVKLMVGLYREFIYLISENQNALSNPFFQSVIASLNKQERAIWNSYTAMAQGKKTTTPEGILSLKVRNTVVFHYGAKAIYKGYNKFFCSGSPGSERAFISRGNGAADTRLFFADAAVRGYFDLEMGQDREILYRTIRQLLDSLILYKIVHNFIQKRFSFRKETEHK